MQRRMKTHPLKEEQINKLLSKVQTGSLATINSNNIPYVIPVHFVYTDKKVYIHGLPKGQKIDNIMNSEKVSFLAYDMQGILPGPIESPCDTNTAYESVIIIGNASLVNNLETKHTILKKFIQKYTPNLPSTSLPEAAIKGTGIIQINVLELTGKYYK